MFRNIKALLLSFTFIIPFITGCSDSMCLHEPSSPELNEELPVELSFLWPGSLDTRGADDTEEKTEFKENDMIHVLGTFNIKYFVDGKTEEGTDTVYRYGALRYKNRKWIAVEGSDLAWPSNAVKGRFKAYYVSGSNGVLAKDENSYIEFRLDSLKLATDPLVATSSLFPSSSSKEDDDGEGEWIPYGRAVQLKFSHICTYLTLIGLEPVVSKEYWFKCDDDKQLKNAFRLSLKEDESGKPTLDFEFIRQSDSKYQNLVYISAPVIETTVIENGNEKAITRASYFLEPGEYKTFSLCYPINSTDGTIYEYLKYDYKNIPKDVDENGEEVENTPPDLKAGTHYTLTVTQSSGVTITSPSSGDGWHDEQEYVNVDVKEFLKAVNEKKAYYYPDEKTGNQTQILEATATGTKLLHNISFHKEKYTTFADGFQPNIDEGTVFDGDYHYIKDLASPLFRYNAGIIRNLGITDINIAAVSSEDKNENQDMSRHGALCMWNRTTATISNVRVANVTMQVEVESKITMNDTNDSETHNIGCVTGSNTGTINEVGLKGDFNLIVTGDNCNASVLIGGIVGQNAGNGKIENISPLEDTPIAITNRCKGQIGAYSVGGVVGESTAIVTNVSLYKVTIDGSESEGVVSYMGGIAGQLNVSEGFEETSKIVDCVVGGSVKAGTTAPSGALTSGSYIGGIAGADLSVPVIGCHATVSVYGSQKAKKGVIYATGGAFGRIREASAYTFKNLFVYGSKLEAPKPEEAGLELTSYTGNFIGVVPTNEVWNDWSAEYANQDIIVRTFSGFDLYGAALDNNNKKESEVTP